MLAGGLGVIGWLAEAYAFHLLLAWMNADIGLWLAVAIFVFATLAGGLTDRASRRRMFVQRADSERTGRQKIARSELIGPGDIIQIEEGFF